MASIVQLLESRNYKSLVFTGIEADQKHSALILLAMRSRSRLKDALVHNDRRVPDNHLSMRAPAYAALGRCLPPRVQLRRHLEHIDGRKGSPFPPQACQNRSLWHIAFSARTFSKQSFSPPHSMLHLALQRVQPHNSTAICSHGAKPLSIICLLVHLAYCQHQHICRLLRMQLARHASQAPMHFTLALQISYSAFDMLSDSDAHLLGHPLGLLLAIPEGILGNAQCSCKTRNLPSVLPKFVSLQVGQQTFA
eukprot:6472991-Amphidinium_carterae.2